MAVTFFNEGTDMPSINKTNIRNWIKQVAELHGKRAGNIAYIFCDDEKIIDVNRQFLKHDYYTDIITFDYTEGDKISGDLFISLDTVRTNAEQFAQTYERELHRVRIHCLLHCPIVIARAVFQCDDHLIFTHLQPPDWRSRAR